MIHRRFWNFALARAYGIDLRERVLDAAADTSARSAAGRFGVGVATAIAWADRAHRHGEREPRKQGRPRGSRLDPHEAFLVGLIEENKDITLDEMVERLGAEQGLGIGRSALSDWLRGRGWTYKKRPPTRWSRSGPTF